MTGHLPVVPERGIEMTSAPAGGHQSLGGQQGGHRSFGNEIEINVPSGGEGNMLQMYAESARVQAAHWQALEERVGLLDSYTKDLKRRVQRLEGEAEGRRGSNGEGEERVVVKTVDSSVHL